MHKEVHHAADLFYIYVNAVIVKSCHNTCLYHILVLCSQYGDDLRVVRRLELIPADFGRIVAYTLHRLPVHHRANTETNILFNHEILSKP